jgi:hypothetical protein
MQNEEHVNLNNLSNGAAVEMFNRELEKVLENICDPNTSPTTAREITLKVTLKPNEDREVGIVAIASNAKLAPVKSVATMVYIGKKSGRFVATENNPRQMAFGAVDASHANQ